MKTHSEQNGVDTQLPATALDSQTWDVGDDRVGLDHDEIPIYDENGCVICAAWPLGEDFETEVPHNALNNARLLAKTPAMLAKLREISTRGYECDAPKLARQFLIDSGLMEK